MPVNKNNTDDLEYLSQLGFEKVSVTDADLRDLNKKIKARIFSYNNGLYFGFISLIIGIFIGVSLFFTVYNKPVLYSSNTPGKILNDSLSDNKIVTQTPIILDTVKVVKENFIDPNAQAKKVLNNTDSINSPKAEAPVVIQSQPVNPDILLDKKLYESKIKYIPNASVFYIHDLKVTNYTTLYFKKNQYVKLPVKGALPVSYANKDDVNKNRSRLKQSADYFLHEEFSEALLLFKKGNYNDCLYAFNAISAYNENDINCNFYSGMSYYYTKNYTKAIEFLERCINDQNNAFLQEAMFYSASSLYENGNKEMALEKFKIIADEGEFYSEKAKSFLAK